MIKIIKLKLSIINTLLIVYFISSFSSLYGQDIIASGNSFNFDKTEFENRYSIMPILSKGKSEEANKADLFYSFVAEKLLASEAKKMGLDTTEISKFTFGAMEKFIIRDALYNIEIKSQAKYSQEEFQDANAKNRFLLDINFIHSNDRNEMDDVFTSLVKGASFDSILMTRKEFELQKNKYTISFGDLEENIENAAYNLSPGKFSGPLPSKTGWFIVRLNDVAEKQIKDEKALKKENLNIRQIVEERAVKKSYASFFNKFFKGKNVNTNGELFWSLSNHIIDLFKEKFDNNNSKESYTLEEKDFYSIAQKMGNDSLNMVFFSLNNHNVTLRQFLYEFIFEGFYTGKANENVIRAKINARVKRFIEHEMLAIEAYKRGLNELSEIKEQIGMWQDYYLAEQYKNFLSKNTEVSEYEINEFINSIDSSSNAVFVNLFEILVKDLGDVETILEKLENEDFRQLARRYSIREDVKNNGGELGWIPVNNYGEIGKIAGQLEIGEVYGPIQTEEGYSIIKLADKKNTLSKLAKIKDMPVSKIKPMLKAKKLRNRLIDETVRIANEESLNVNQVKVSNSSVKNQNMFIYRYYGFGGRTLAVPQTPVFTEWVKPWQQSKKDLP